MSGKTARLIAGVARAMVMPGVRGPRARGEAGDEMPESEMKFGVAVEAPAPAPSSAPSGGGGELGTRNAISASTKPFVSIITGRQH